MFWRLHKAILGNSCEKVLELLRGDNVELVVDAFSPPVPKALNEASFTITTLQDAKRLVVGHYPSEPWLYFNHKDYQVSSWLSHLHDFPTLNDDTIFLPYALITESRLKSLGDKYFIRPNSGNKIFTGFSFTTLEEMKYNLDYFKLSPEDMCAISSHKSIKAQEYRFWICEREIIGMSPYSWNKEPMANWVIPSPVIDMAHKLTQHSYQPAECYVADFCIETSGVKLVEINAFSTSGFYEGLEVENFFEKLKDFCERKYKSYEMD